MQLLFTAACIIHRAKSSPAAAVWAKFDQMRFAGCMCVLRGLCLVPIYASRNFHYTTLKPSKQTDHSLCLRRSTRSPVSVCSLHGRECALLNKAAAPILVVCARVKNDLRTRFGSAEFAVCGSAKRARHISICAQLY
jgi:hypothetical protein